MATQTAHSGGTVAVVQRHEVPTASAVCESKEACMHHYLGSSRTGFQVEHCHSVGTGSTCYTSMYCYLEDRREQRGAMGGRVFSESIFEALAVASIPTVSRSYYSRKHD